MGRSSLCLHVVSFESNQEVPAFQSQGLLETRPETGWCLASHNTHSALAKREQDLAPVVFGGGVGTAASLGLAPGTDGSHCSPLLFPRKTNQLPPKPSFILCLFLLPFSLPEATVLWAASAGSVWGDLGTVSIFRPGARVQENCQGHCQSLHPDSSLSH